MARASEEPPVYFLLVDDKPQNLVALEGLLRREGLELLKATSGSEALELLLKYDVGLAILDVEMPGMTGLELAELMRGIERTKHVPIIFVTAGTTHQNHLFDGYDYGAVAFLQKPIEPRILKNKASTFFELRRQRARLESTLRFHEMFVAALGHDLRNPLNSIMMAAQVLQTALPEGDRELVQGLLGSARTMGQMIDELQDLSRARMTGSIALSVRVVDVQALARAAVDERSLDAPGRISLSGEGDFRIEGDATRLARAVSNLVANAIKHGERGGPVDVELLARDAEVEVRVGNRGVIDPVVASRMFEPFVGTKSRRGMGLGLYIVERVASAHGGSITCTSDDAHGTVFVMRLPRRHRTKEAAATLERDTPSA
jgi:signal transduction histidine kinase